MPEHAVTGILPPVRLSSIDEALYSVEILFPSPVTDELQRYAAQDGTSWERAAEEALMFYRESFMTREDHARENVEWVIRNFGPPKRRLSRKQREKLNQRMDQELSDLRANRALGNLILPIEIYSFVRRQVEGGPFASPTDVLAAALPFLLAQQGKPKRADFVY